MKTSYPPTTANRRRSERTYTRLSASEMAAVRRGYASRTSKGRTWMFDLGRQIQKDGYATLDKGLVGYGYHSRTSNV